MATEKVCEIKKYGGKLVCDCKKERNCPHIKKYADGKNEFTCNYVDGKQHGKRETWYKDGQLESVCNYVDGKRHGKYEAWYKDGQLNVVCHYKNGLLHGTFEDWCTDGTKAVTCTYENDLLHGKFTEWHNSVISYECDYVKGKEYKQEDKTKDSDKNKDDKPIKSEQLDQYGRSIALGEGKIYVWKACMSRMEFWEKFEAKKMNHKRDDSVYVYVKIEVPEDAKRMTPAQNNNTYNSRVSHGIVRQIVDCNGNEYREATSFVYGKDSVLYELGWPVAPSG